MSDEFLTSERPDADAVSGMQHQPALDPAVTLAEYAESSAASPEPVSRTLRALTERSFTGEVEFALGTGVLVYLDGGRTYYAERVGDAPLGERLVSLGVLRDEQLRQGQVQVGDVEHLGRLFEREPTIDRDAVIAATELITDEVLGEIAPLDATVAFTSYRHHRSGVHRWFVGPGRASSLRPVDEVRQLDRSVFDKLPDVSGSSEPLPRPTADIGEPFDPPEVRIEWDQPEPTHLERRPLDLPEIDEADIDAELRSFDADVADWSGPDPRDIDPRDIDPVVVDSEAIDLDVVDRAHDRPTPTGADDRPRGAASPPAGVAPSAGSAGGDGERGDAAATMPGTDAAHGRTAGALDEFTIVWPDGSSDETISAADAAASHRPPPGAGDGADPARSDGDDLGHRSTPPSEPTSDDGRIRLGVPTPTPVMPPPVVAELPPPLALSGGGEATPPHAPGPAPLPAPTGAVTEASKSWPQPVARTPTDLSLPPLIVERLPDADAQVPDEVADAVRRALAAIERVSSEPEAATRLRVGTVDLPDVEMPKLLDPSVLEPAVEPDHREPAPEAAPVADRPPLGMPVPPPSAAFAPPTADTSAEAVYARAAAARPPATTDTELPEPGQASVVFVEPERAEDERKGALKRLIGSLRRK